MARLKDENKKRIYAAFLLISLFLFMLLFRVAWIQIVRGDEYREKAVMQQTSDIPIQPKRGKITDRNGKELAATATGYTVWIRPETLKKEVSSSEKIKQISRELAVPLDMAAEDVHKKITGKENIECIKRCVERGTVDSIIKQQIPGIEISEENRRFYPMGDFAATVIGSVNREGTGRSGIEQEYNRYLSGVAGRWIKDTDRNGDMLSYGNRKYHGAEDGVNVRLTIDEILQHYMEEIIEDWQEKTEADNIYAIAMDPKTGDILVMAKSPSFNPNDSNKAKGENSKDLNRKWRNQMVSDVYEPGSTFKLITAAAVLEEGLATPETPFYCPGKITVAGHDIYDWNRKPHGALTLTSAVGESCNPSHVKMAQMLGIDRFYDTIDRFGFCERTGIDLPAEGNSIMIPKEKIGPLELATIGFGQGIAVTPMQLITAISSFGNDGTMMKPRIVEGLYNDKGEKIKGFPVEEIRRTVSKTTAREMRAIMEADVTDYGGKKAYVPGYRIGGKTGTAEKAKNGVYTNEVVASFVSMAPIEDPAITVLIIVDNPKTMTYGGVIVAPMSGEFYEKALPYLHIKRGEVDESSENHDESEVPGDEKKPKYIYVPNVIGKMYSEASEEFVEDGIEYVVRPSLTKDEKKDKEFDFKIVDQYPKAGKKMDSSNKVYLYRK